MVKPYPPSIVLADIAAPVLVKVVLALNVTAPLYVCVDEVVTFAPRSEVVDTDNEVALLIAWLRSKDPVILIAPKVLVQPTIPSNCTSDAVMVRLFVSPVSELTVVSKVIWAFVVVRVLSPVTVTAPS